MRYAFSTKNDKLFLSPNIFGLKYTQPLHLLSLCEFILFILFVGHLYVVVLCHHVHHPHLADHPHLGGNGPSLCHGICNQVENDKSDGYSTSNQ